MFWTPLLFLQLSLFAFQIAITINVAVRGRRHLAEMNRLLACIIRDSIEGQKILEGIKRTQSVVDDPS